MRSHVFQSRSVIAASRSLPLSRPALPSRLSAVGARLSSSITTLTRQPEEIKACGSFSTWPIVMKSIEMSICDCKSRSAPEASRMETPAGSERRRKQSDVIIPRGNAGRLRNDTGVTTRQSASAIRIRGDDLVLRSHSRRFSSHALQLLHTEFDSRLHT